MQTHLYMLHSKSPLLTYFMCSSVFLLIPNSLISSTAPHFPFPLVTIDLFSLSVSQGFFYGDANVLRKGTMGTAGPACACTKNHRIVHFK